MCTVKSNVKTSTLEGCDNYGSEILDIPAGGLYTGSSDCIVDEPDAQNQRDCCSATGDWLKDTASNVFRKKTLYRRLPILEWLPKYNRNDVVGDLVAGITVGLTVIPQGLAFAGITGLELQVSEHGFKFESKYLY